MSFSDEKKDVANHDLQHVSVEAQASSAASPTMSWGDQFKALRDSKRVVLTGE